MITDMFWVREPNSNSTLLSICWRQSFSDCLRGFLDAELFIFAQTLPDVTLWSKTWTLVKIQVLPHFDLYPLQNIKQRDYLDFKEALSIINSGLHLTPEGIAQFKAIKEGMNSFRSS